MREMKRDQGIDGSSGTGEEYADVGADEGVGADLDLVAVEDAAVEVHVDVVALGR